MRTNERIGGDENPTGTRIPHTLSASTIIGDPVVNEYGEDLGKIEELMIDLDGGRVAYAVLSFGGLFGIGDKLFAVPLEAMQIDTENHRFVLDVDRERLEQAPGFDKDEWPDSADLDYRRAVFVYYGHDPYWE
ncbi:MAG TPA: PRC-barrel domain-containing protein [Gemmatimonadota bacterium]|nr:PRC-barrel domain-containing protein [Gemmatimonadota bacterium]